jgi:hypothetical protein
LLSVIGSRKTRFELTRWLEADADARDAGEAGRATAFQCEAGRCAAKVQGMQVTVAKTADAELCKQPGILILQATKPEACAPPGGVVVDAQDIARLGAHALTIENGKVRRETVAEARGVRPWSTHRAADAQSE